MRSIRHAPAIAMLAALAVGSVARAQDQDPRPAGPGGAGERHWDPAAMKTRMEQRRMARAQTLHDALGLRPEQESAWQAFLADARRPAGERREHEGREPGEQRDQLTTPERLDRMQQRLESRRAAFERRAGAIKRFYAVLDARQQKVFDALATSGGRWGMGLWFGGRRRG